MMLFQWTITNPLTEINSDGYGDLFGVGGNGGLTTFISNVIKFAIVAAGLFAFINLIIAGYTYLSAGSDSKKTADAWARIYMSLIGLVIMVASFAITAIISTLLFGKPDAILNPTIYGPGLKQP